WQVLAAARQGGRAALLRAHLWLVADSLRALPGAWYDVLFVTKPSVDGAGHTNLFATTIDELRDDTRYAFRLWRRSGGFALPALLSLGLGIGAAVAMFSVIYAVL